MGERATPILLEQKYRLVEAIGRGGMGAVFRALDISLGRSVAVKFLLPELLGRAELIERFHAEAKAMASVRHPKVAQIYSFGWFGRTPYFVMEYAEGQTADVLIQAAEKRCEMIGLSEALGLIDQAAEGLAAVHDAGVVHRDVKPGNLIYQPEADRVVLMDFGIGHRVEPGKEAEVSIGGTPAYMAPELISGQTFCSEEEYLADIYSLGISAFELLTGQLPFACESFLEAVTWHVTKAPRPPSSLRPELPPGLDEIVLTCLEKAPGDRYQSCHELREALRPLCREVSGRPECGRPQRKSDTPPPSSHIRRASPPTVILARPDPSLIGQARSILERDAPGCHLIVTRSVAEALEIAHRRRLGVIVANLNDPRINGLELAATVAGDPSLRHLRVILTAYELSRAEGRLLERLGVVDVLGRPVSPAQLSAALAAALANGTDSSDCVTG